MSIEIKELIVRVQVNEQHSSLKQDVKQVSNIDQKAIIEACVNKVLERLEAKAER